MDKLELKRNCYSNVSLEIKNETGEKSDWFKKSNCL